MAIDKIPNTYVNNNAAWIPLRTVAIKVNEVIDEVNDIIDGEGTETFENITVTDTATIENLGVNDTIGVETIDATTIETVTLTALDFETGSFTMNKTSVVQTGSITTTVVANRQAFKITTVSSTLAADASATFTCTNSTVTANSVIVLSAYTSGAGQPIASVVSQGAGTFDIKVYNAGGVALDNTIVISAWVVV